MPTRSERCKRPHRATLVHTQRRKKAWKDVPVIFFGGIEASPALYRAL
ncbi:hypothetical protein ACNKHW_19120 [Shigella flexneri]